MLACLLSVLPGCSLRETKTPLEKTRYEKLTGYDEMHAFLNKLAQQSANIELDTLGVSDEGRPIPYLRIGTGEFGTDRINKLTVLIFAQQHGDEPSGKEAALALARDFAAGKLNDILEHLDILLVPQVNPDGAENYERTNASGIDLNRNHLILTAPETEGLHKLFQQWEPYVTLDIHEYQPWVETWLEHGYIKLFDAQFGIPTNLNTSPAIRTFAEDEFLSFAGEHLNAAGYTFHNYLVGSPARIRYSTTNVNDGRQSFGIFNTFSLILEGKNGLTPSDNIERRTASQRYAVETLLKFSAERKKEISSLVRNARSDLLIGEPSEFVPIMLRRGDRRPLSIPVLGVERVNGEYEVRDTIHVEIANYLRNVVPGKRIPAPEAYIVPVQESAIIRLLEKRSVLMREMEEGEVIAGEEYLIESFETREIEDTDIITPKVERQTAIYIAQAGDRLVPLNQLQRNLIMTALEAESMHNLMQYREFAQLRRTGRYPILRVTAADLVERR